MLTFRFLILTSLLVFILKGQPLFAADTSPEGLLDEARKGRVELIKVVSDVTAIVPTIPRKEELFQYFLALDDLSLLEKNYGLESLGQSPVSLLGFALANAATKWIRIDRDQPEYIELFMKYADNIARSNLAGQQSAYLVNDMPVSDVVLLIEKSAWVIQLATVYKSDFYVIVAFEDFQGLVVRRFFVNVATLPDEQIELVISKVTAISALNEVDAFMHVLAANADTAQKVLRALRFACIFDRSVKQNPRSSLALQNAAAGAINDAVQRLINLRGAVPAGEIQAAIQILSPAVVVNVSSLIVTLSDRLVYREQIDFLLALAKALSLRLAELGMGQQQISIDAFVSRLQIMQRVSFKSFEGSYDVKFKRSGNGILTILHTGGGRLAATMSFINYFHGIEMPFSLFYFEYDQATKVFQSTRFPFDNTEGQLPSDMESDMYFSIEEDTGCLVGKFGAPMTQDYFRACLREKVVSFDEEMPGEIVKDYTSLWKGRCGRNSIVLRIAQVGRRLVANWMDNDTWNGVPLNYGIANPLAHSAILTSGPLEVGRFVQVRVRFEADGRLEVEYILAGRGIACHTYFYRLNHY